MFSSDSSSLLGGFEIFFFYLVIIDERLLAEKPLSSCVWRLYGTTLL